MERKRGRKIAGKKLGVFGKGNLKNEQCFYEFEMPI